MAWVDALRSSPPAGVAEVVPAAETALVLAGDSADVKALATALQAVVPAPVVGAEGPDGEVVEIEVRYDGPDLRLPRRGAVSPSGEPVLFLADHPVTGGYPVVAVVVDADVDLAAQVRPGQVVRFRWVPPPFPDVGDLSAAGGAARRARRARRPRPWGG